MEHRPAALTIPDFGFAVHRDVADHTLVGATGDLLVNPRGEVVGAGNKLWGVGADARD
jgi:hypothetical protein